jgi:hypothetical protein
LRGIHGKLPIWLTDCSTPSVRIDREAVPEINLFGLRLVAPPERTVGYYLRSLRNSIPTSVAVTSFLFAFLAIKVLWVAHGDVPTALGVFGSSPPTTVVVGGLLSGISILVAATLGIIFFFVLTEPLSKRAITVMLLATIGCAFLTPWKVAALSAFLGIAAGLVKRCKRRNVAFAGLLILGLAAIVLISPALMDAVWLPHEDLTLTPLTPSMPRHRVGYVLNDANGWVTLLHTGDRHIMRIPSHDVIQRSLCRLNHAPAGTWPFLWSPTLWTEIAGGLHLKLPLPQADQCRSEEN